MPEARSFIKMARSCGKANTELKEGKTPQKMAMKKRRPRRSWMSRGSECHHMRPASKAAVNTWNTLKELKVSCFRSFRLLWRRMLNWLNHEDMALMVVVFWDVLTGV